MTFGIGLGAHISDLVWIHKYICFLFTIKHVPIYFGPPRFQLLVPLAGAQDPPAKKEPKAKAKAKAAAEP